jgi:hypothetical protein
MVADGMMISQRVCLCHAGEGAADPYAEQVWVTPRATYNYTTLVDVTGKTSVVLGVMGQSNGAVLLSDGSARLPVEIVIGGWGNTQSVMRDGVQGNFIAQAETVGIMRLDEPQYFWMAWFPTKLTLGRVCCGRRRLRCSATCSICQPSRTLALPQGKQPSSGDVVLSADGSFPAFTAVSVTGWLDTATPLLWTYPGACREGRNGLGVARRSSRHCCLCRHA